jgi:hypothetical protein
MNPRLSTRAQHEPHPAIPYHAPPNSLCLYDTRREHVKYNQLLITGWFLHHQQTATSARASIRGIYLICHLHRCDLKFTNQKLYADIYAVRCSDFTSTFESGTFTAPPADLPNHQFFSIPDSSSSQIRARSLFSEIYSLE